MHRVLIEVRPAEVSVRGFCVISPDDQWLSAPAEIIRGAFCVTYRPRRDEEFDGRSLRGEIGIETVERGRIIAGRA